MLPVRRECHQLQAKVASRERRVARQEPQNYIQDSVCGTWVDLEAQGDRDARRLAEAKRQRNPVATRDATPRANRDDTDVWSISFQTAQKIIPTKEIMSPQVRERGGRRVRREEADLHHGHPTRLWWDEG
eukprot:7255190-Prymnesium_polylepis.1